MNSVSLSGHLTHDPKLIYRNDRPICEMRLAVDNGKFAPTYIDVCTYDEQAYACAEYMHIGSRIGVNGRLNYREWRAEDESKRERYSVTGWVEFLDPAPIDDETEEVQRQLALVA